MIRYKVSNRPRILFVGINPHHGSFRRGVPFSNNKTFWYLLNRAGVLEENAEEMRSDRALKHIYEAKFLQKYRLNFVKLVDHPTTQVTELKRGDEIPGVHLVQELIHRNRPEVVCFIGRVTYHKFLGNSHFRFGWQKSIESSRIFVMHFPIRGPSGVRIRQLKRILAHVTRTGDWQGTSRKVD